MRRLPALYCAVCFRLFAGTVLHAAEPPAIAAPTSVSELSARITAQISQPRFSGALWSVKVASLETGRTLFEHHADRLMSPASNSKLYTAALALDQFGGDYRIATPLFATAKPDSIGCLTGSIVVSGRGDPSWKATARDGDFWKTFDPFVAAIKQSGIRQITGDIIADTTYFRSPPYGSGWTADDLNDDYGAEVSAITLEENFIDLRVVPSAVVGRACEFTLSRPHTGLIFHNRTITTAKGGARTIHAQRGLGSNVVYVFGELPLGGPVELLDITVPRPARWFAVALKHALIRAGVPVEGEGRSVQWPEASPISHDAVRLGEIVSPPLRDLVRAFLKPSQNLETDLIFAQVGESKRPVGAPEWRTSEHYALAALREFLRGHGLAAEEVRFEEGSGLSRNNLTSANATVALLTFMASHRDGAAFMDALPIAGVDGTLRRRMKGTAAEENVRAKTGTLRWANALSGYVTSAAGERLVFSVMLNRNAQQPSARNVREELDDIVVLLAQLAKKSNVMNDVSATR